MSHPRDRHLRRELELRAAKELYYPLRQRYERDRDDLEAAWTKLFLAMHEALVIYRGSCLARVISGLKLLRGKRLRSGHTMQYLGERAMGSVDIQPWTYWRGKRVALEAGWVYRFEVGGGRLKKSAGGGKGDDGKWKGKADGVVPGPHITGWSEERYARLQVEAPPAPRVWDVDPADTGAASLGHEFGSNRNLLQLIDHRTRPPT